MKCHVLEGCRQLALGFHCSTSDDERSICKYRNWLSLLCLESDFSSAGSISNGQDGPNVRFSTELLATVLREVLLRHPAQAGNVFSSARGSGSAATSASITEKSSESSPAFAAIFLDSPELRSGHPSKTACLYASSSASVVRPSIQLVIGSIRTGCYANEQGFPCYSRPSLRLLSIASRRLSARFRIDSATSSSPGIGEST